VPANLLRRFTKLDHPFGNFSNFPEFGAASNYTSRIEYNTGVFNGTSLNVRTYGNSN